MSMCYPFQCAPNLNLSPIYLIVSSIDITTVAVTAIMTAAVFAMVSVAVDYSYIF